MLAEPVDKHRAVRLQDTQTFLDPTIAPCQVDVQRLPVARIAEILADVVRRVGHHNLGRIGREGGEQLERVATQHLLAQRRRRRRRRRLHLRYRSSRARTRGRARTRTSQHGHERRLGLARITSESAFAAESPKFSERLGCVVHGGEFQREYRICTKDPIHSIFRRA